MQRISSEPYSQNEVNRIFAHLNNRTLLVWAERGLVETAGETVDKRGRNRLYSDINLLQIALVERMAALNLNFETIKEIMGHFAFGTTESGKPTLLELLENEQNLIIGWTLKGGKERQPRAYTHAKEGQSDPLGLMPAYEMEIKLRLPIIFQWLETLKDAALSG
jgi:DNA-binding transcriptional MerR regulator